MAAAAAFAIQNPRTTAGRIQSLHGHVRAHALGGREGGDDVLPPGEHDHLVEDDVPDDDGERRSRATAARRTRVMGRLSHGSRAASAPAAKYARSATMSTAAPRRLA